MCAIVLAMASQPLASCQRAARQQVRFVREATAIEVVALLCWLEDVQYQPVGQHRVRLGVLDRRVPRGGPRPALQLLQALEPAGVHVLALIQGLLLFVALRHAQRRLVTGTALRHERVRADLHLWPLEEGRAPLLEGPGRHLQLLEGVVRQREEAEHGHDQIGNVGGEVRIVVHALRADEELPGLAEPVELLPVPAGDDLVLSPVDDHRGAGHILHGDVI
mmetsp:Transcript_80466/g.236672  ORF Transcript_80466/g.236672 Transcript_80466/m.236672 type:complete len:220 (-) Transcript_80466:718-1377(-)